MNPGKKTKKFTEKPATVMRGSFFTTMHNSHARKAELSGCQSDMSFLVVLNQMKEIIKDNPFVTKRGKLTDDLRQHKLLLLKLVTDRVKQSTISLQFQDSLLRIMAFVQNNFELSPIDCGREDSWQLIKYLENINEIELLFKKMPKAYSDSLKAVLGQIGFGFDHQGNDCLKIQFEAALQIQLLNNPQWYKDSVYKVSSSIYDKISRLDFMNKSEDLLTPDDVAMLNRVLHYPSSGTRLNDQSEFVEGDDFGRIDLPPEHLTVDKKREYIRLFLLNNKTDLMAHMVFHHVFIDDLALKLYQPKKLSLFPAIRTLMPISAFTVQNPGSTAVQRQNLARYAGLALQYLQQSPIARLGPKEHQFGNTGPSGDFIRNDQTLSHTYPTGDRGRKMLKGPRVYKTYLGYRAFFSSMRLKKPFINISQTQGVDPESARGIKALSFNEPFVAGPSGSAAALVAGALEASLTPGEFKAYSLAILAKTLSYHSSTEVLEKILHSGYGFEDYPVSIEDLNNPSIFPDHSEITNCLRQLNDLYPLLDCSHEERLVSNKRGRSDNDDQDLPQPKRVCT